MPSFAKVRDQVRTAFGRDGYDSYLEFLKGLPEDDLKLQGGDRPEDFVESNLVYVLYHDIKGIGWGTLCAEIKRKFPIAKTTIRRNAKTIRKAGYRWAREQVQLGTAEDWNEATVNGRRAEWLRKVNLWMDSSDFSLKRNSARGSWDDDHHSFKLNHPGLRFMVLMDGRGRVVLMRGGYSPKRYDGHFLEWEQSEIAKNLVGGHIVADQHFKIGKTLFDDPVFYVATGKKRKRDSDVDDEVFGGPTEKQKTADHQLCQMRSRVEVVFARIKNKWATLDPAWEEEPEQLTYAVWIAVAADRVARSSH